MPDVGAAFADKFGVGFVEYIVHAALQSGVFVDFPACVERKDAEACGCAEVLADDVTLALRITVLLGGYAPKCACAEFAVVPSKAAVPF